MSEALILDAVRTPRGRGKAGKGALSGLHPQELFAQTLTALAARTGLDPAEVDDVVVGCVTQAGEQGGNLARQAVLAAGWPVEVTGVTLTRVCGSGLQAAGFAAMGVMSGLQRLVVAGGVESMSRVAMGADGAGQDGGNERLREHFFQVPQGISADLIATLEGFSREEVDAWALQSQLRAAAAIREGRFDRSLVPVRDPASGATLLEHDEHPRPDTTAAGLAALAPSFASLGAKPLGPGGETHDDIVRRAYPRAAEVHH
ncbi:MAG TPA: acetyl-CoA C-acyltransferase, partial [Thermoanaerobaculia bacterium]|nr:acetyl-CoA C-acyltransferase [Thermoanaerobaculia bacterium]